jgi:hypothetical protein
MKTKFLVLLFSYIYALSELAEKKKREIYLRRIFNSEVANSKVYYDYDEKNNLVIKSKEPINSRDSLFFIPSNNIFTNRILVFI